jgi:hypothetical protein
MKWLPQPVPPTLFSAWNLPALQLVLAIYINHLWNDNGVFHKRIKGSTIKAYIREAAGLLALSGSRIVDVRKDDQTSNSLGLVIKRMFTELDRYESAKNRREAFTVPMLDLAIAQAALAPWPDHLHVVLADWYEVCLFTGSRKSEWAQPDERHKDLGSFYCNLFGDAYAFRMTDFRIETYNNERRSGLACLDFAPSDAKFMWITYRMQKNGQHGEERMYTASPGKLCFIRAIYRIMLRFRRLVPQDHALVNPLAVYRSTPSGPTVFVTPRVVMIHMRALAAVVHKLHPSRDSATLRLWSSHSLRVGACVVLQEAGFSSTQIQWLLRWRSQAFMDYLRNLPGLALQQSHAINQQDGVMPNVYAPLGALRG